MYRCAHCLQEFLLRVEPCPGCVDRASERTRARRAKERRAGYDRVGRIDDAQFWDLLRLYPCCPCCGRGWAVAGIVARDHIVPLSRSGPNELRNIQPLCQECNLWKGDHIIHFDRHFPGRCASLPDHLAACLPATPPGPQQTQLLLIAPAEVDTALRYPRASPRQLETITLHLTRSRQK